MELYRLEYDNGQPYEDNDHYFLGLFTELDLAVAYAEATLRKYVTQPPYYKHGDSYITIYAVVPDDPTVDRAVKVLHEGHYMK